MSKVKLLSNLQTENGIIAEGKVVDLPDAEAEHLIKLGAAESSDATIDAALTDKPQQEVETPVDPLVEQTAGPSEAATPPEPPVTPTVEPSTPAVPASSSTNLHLG